MTNHLRLFVILLLIAGTAVQCSALRTRCNTLRVQRVRRLDEIDQ